MKRLLLASLIAAPSATALIASPAAAESRCTNTYSCTVGTTPTPTGPQPVFTCSYTRTCK
jgi:hypothetical protein